VLSSYDQITRYVSKDLLWLDERLMRLYQASYEQKVVEELCALYVGMTRAKRGLEMIVQPREANKSGGTKLRESMAGILLGALREGNAVVESGELLWEAPGSKLPERIELSAASAAEKELEVKVLPSSGRVRPTVSPSSLEGGGFVELGRSLTLENAPAMMFGSLMHAFFELVEWLPGDMAEEKLREAARKLGASEKEIAGAIEAFGASMRQANVRRAMSRPSARGGEVEVWRERAFAVRVKSTEGDVILEGRLDRVVVERKAGVAVGAEVVDFKTDGVGDAEKLNAAVEKYRPQIDAYKKAVAGLLGLSVEMVRGTLLFVTGDVVVAV
jgi:ATP-dependent exoDNAse (exonuclease V) beta subunit